ncbi:hypothetical protein ACFLTR_03905 [Chloroflexota bacterium]
MNIVDILKSDILTSIVVLLTLFILAFMGWQIWLLRKQLRGEVYKRAKIKGLCFYLPEKQKRSVTGFESAQKEKEEVNFDKELQLIKDSEIEVHVKFFMDAPQRLRAITWGFVDKFAEKEYEGRPTIPRLQRAFKVVERQHFERELYMDWGGQWHMEFPFSRFLPKDECFVLCFIVKTNGTGKYPLVFEIRTEEAKNNHVESLWVDVLP